MLAGLAADLVVLIHFSFIIFVVLGGLLVLRWPNAAWFHLPAAAWGAWIEFAQGTCPLTPLEKRLRAMAGDTSYDGGFISHYIIPIIYPPGLTPKISAVLGTFVVLVTVLIYGIAIRNFKKRKTPAR